MVDLFFSWVTALVKQGYRQQRLNTQDLLPLPSTATPRACTSDLWNQWSKTCARGSPSLLRAVVGAYGGPYYCLGVLKLINDALTFAGAMLLNLLVRHLEQATAAAGAAAAGTVGSTSGPWPAWFPGPGSHYWGFLLAAVLGLSALLKAIISSHYNYGLSIVTVRLRGGVMGVLFRSALLNRAADAAGDVSTLMAVDTGRLANLCMSFHELWSLPLQIAAAMWLLYIQVRTAFLAGVLLCVALIPVNRAIAQRIQAASVDLMTCKDSRLALLSQLLSHMGVVKALGWEQVLGNKVHEFRSSELSALARRKYLDALCVYFWAATQLLLSGTTFGLMVLLGQPLRPSTVFTCLALFNVLIAPLNAFPWVVNGVVEAFVSLRRIQAYLLLPQRCMSWAYPENMLPDIATFQQQQRQDLRSRQQQQQWDKDKKNGLGSWWNTHGRQNQRQYQVQDSTYATQQQQQQRQRHDSGQAQVPGGGGSGDVSDMMERGVAAQFDKASFSWSKGQPTCLSQLQLAIPAGCLTAIVGEVGSGKSSLLAALLGELELIEGHVKLPHQSQQQQYVSRVGYVAQTPWIMGGTVRDNICMGQQYDAEFMGEILHAVGLDQDLAAMPRGDLTAVGDAGQKLSGGQRQRVALARALYQPGTDTYLFDDILASLDSHVAQWVIRHTLFGGLLSGATVVVVTKHPLVIQAAQLVIGLEHGRVAYCGSAQGFAHWKALQAVQLSPRVSALPTPGTWAPLVRHSTPHLRRLRHQQQHLATTPPPSSSNSSHPKADLPAEGAHPTTPPAYFSEDVAPSELLLAGGQGVWASHASLSPQLHVIPDDDEHEAPEGTALSQSMNSRSLSRSFGRTSDMEEGDSLQGAAGGEGSTAAASAAAASPAAGGIGYRSEDDDGVNGSSVDAALDVPGQQQQQGSASANEVPITVWGRKLLLQQQQQHSTSPDSKQHTTATATTAAAAAVIPPPPPDHGIDAAAAGADSSDATSREDEERAVGAVRWSVYAAYAKAVGLGMTLAVLVSLLIMQVTKNGIDLWVTHNLQHSTNALPQAAAAVMSRSSSLVVGDHSSLVPGVRSTTSSTMYQSGSAMMSAAAAGDLYAAAAAAGGGVTVMSYYSAAAAAAAAAAGSTLPVGAFENNLINSRKVVNISSWSHERGCGAVAQQQEQQRDQRQQQQQVVSSRRLLQLLPPHDAPAASFSQPSAAVAAARTTKAAAASHSYETHLELPCQETVGQQQQQQQQQHQSYSTPSSHTPTPHWQQLQWQPAPLEPQMAYFLKGLGIIAALNTLATLARAFSFAAAGMAAAEGMHQRLLAAVLAAPMSFFDANPAGRILNRFSSDTSKVDDSLPFILNILLANAVSLAGLLAVLLLGQPLLLLVLLPLGAAYRWLQLFYRGTARELRRLEAQGLSPLYGLFGEAAAGAATIRAAAAQRHFMKCFLLLMEPYQTACQNNAAASNWLGARLQLLAAVLLTAVAGLAAAVAAAAAAKGSNTVLSLNDHWSSSTMSTDFGSTGSTADTSSSTWGGTVNGSGSTSSTFRVDLLGLALAYCLPIVQLLNGLLTSSAETEQEMVAVERVVAYLDDIAPEEQQQQQQQQQQKGPPAAAGVGRRRRRQQQQPQQRQLPLATASDVEQQLQQPLLQHQQQQSVLPAAAAAAADSAIAFVDVVMRYRPELPPALRGVSFTVKNGQKLGICGRTGAGKSSIVAALLRLRPIQSGFILVQGQDAKTLSLKTLRGQFGVVPQSPVLFAGTLRENLDPCGNASYQQLAAALQAVRMWAPLCKMALQRGVLSHGTYLLARRAGSTANLAAAAADTTTEIAPPPPPAAAAAAAAGVSAGGREWLDVQTTGGGLTADELAEGAAAAVGAAAGVAAAAAAAADGMELLDAESRLTRLTGSTGGASTDNDAQQQQWQQQRQQRSGSSAVKFPPIPMGPAQDVLSMKVCGSGGLQLSSGQSQLVCLARLLLRGAPLVLLDEATAAVDPHTAAVMHQVLHEQLDVSSTGDSSNSSSQPTVLQIAHELTAIIDYDAVVVMASGKVVEQGNPRQLAAQEGSKFANLLAQAGHHNLPPQQQ